MLLALFFASSLPALAGARETPADSVRLRFPMEGQDFHVIHGGSSEATNHHYTVQAQRYALDIVQLDGFGVRASGFLPDDPDAYAIYGTPVVAPCSGGARVSVLLLSKPAGELLGKTLQVPTPLGGRTMDLRDVGPRVAVGDDVP